LFPEITVSTIGQDHMRARESKTAVEVLELVLLAYPDSADANETLSEAYLADGQKNRRDSTPGIVVDRYGAIRRRDSSRRGKNSQAAEAWLIGRSERQQG